MLSEEEKQAIKYFYNLRSTIDESYMLFDEEINVKCGKDMIKQISLVFNLITKLQKENEELKQENEELKQENKRIKYFSNNLYIGDYIPKRVIKNKIKEKQDKINKLHSASDCVIIDDLENQISVLQELLESSGING